MHCPQCGQQQISGEVRFCKSCGFPLDGVRELLASGGVSSTIEKEGHTPGQSPRRQGVRQGFMLLFIFIVSVPLYGLIGKPVMALPPLLLIAGLMRILYAVIFQEGAPRKKQQRFNTLPDVAPSTNDQSGTATRGTALPPAQSVPVTAFNARRVDTREMVNPPSVTERTTKLLKESPDPK
jgi:hypothetical protein